MNKPSSLEFGKKPYFFGRFFGKNQSIFSGSTNFSLIVMTQAPRQKKFIPLHSWTPWCNNLVHRVQKFTPISSSVQRKSIKIVSTTNFEIFTLYNNEKDCCLSVVSTSIRLKLQVRVSLSHSIIWHFQGMHLLWWFGHFLYIFCIEPSLSLYTFRT